MSLPTVADFILSFLHDAFQFDQLGRAESLVDGQLDFRFESEFRLAVRQNYMDVHSRLFPREEIKPIAAIPKNRRTHAGKVSEPPGNSTAFPATRNLECGGRAQRRHRFRADGWLSSWRKILVRAKAAWRFASRRSPWCNRLARGGAAFVGYSNFLPQARQVRWRWPEDTGVVMV
jgi:hypothetical protein